MVGVVVGEGVVVVVGDGDDVVDVGVVGVVVGVTCGLWDKYTATPIITSIIMIATTIPAVLEIPFKREWFIPRTH